MTPISREEVLTIAAADWPRFFTLHRLVARAPEVLALADGRALLIRTGTGAGAMYTFCATVPEPDAADDVRSLQALRADLAMADAAAGTADSPGMTAVEPTSAVSSVTGGIRPPEGLWYVFGDSAAEHLTGLRRPVWHNACLQMALMEHLDHADHARAEAGMSAINCQQGNERTQAKDGMPFEAASDDARIIELEEGHAAFIHAHYEMREILDVAYVRDRIREGPALGIEWEGRLAGWVMTHEEGTMGVLEILPEFRRLGLATRLNRAMCDRMRARGWPCVVEILKTNAASQALAAGAGFRLLRNVHWIHFDG